MTDASASDRTHKGPRLAREENRLQARVIMPTARTLYLVVACGALATIVVALVALAIFQAGTMQSARLEPIPTVVQGPAPDIPMNVVDAHLQPPINIKLVVNLPYISHPLKGDELVGGFTAYSRNGLAEAPDDFIVIGGKDADLFERTTFTDGASQRTGLRAKPTLVESINKVLPSLTGAQTQTFQVEVLAYDRYHVRSAPTTVSFDLTYGPAAASKQALASTASGSKPETDLERLADEISLVVDPEGTSKRFDARARALEIPKQCGATNVAEFLADYRKSFEHAKASLSGENIEAFYAGVCDAWSRVVSAEAVAREKAESARTAAIARNSAAQASAAAKRLASVGLRSISLTVVAGALGLFMIVTLLLAFFAIENHTKAVRLAVEAIARERTFESE